MSRRSLAFFFSSNERRRPRPSNSMSVTFYLAPPFFLSHTRTFIPSRLSQTKTAPTYPSQHRQWRRRQRPPGPRAPSGPGCTLLGALLTTEEVAQTQVATNLLRGGGSLRASAAGGGWTRRRRGTAPLPPPHAPPPTKETRQRTPLPLAPKTPPLPKEEREKEKKERCSSAPSSLCRRTCSWRGRLV